MLVFDIETGPLPDDQLERLFDCDVEAAIPHPGEFDPNTVRYGNTRDPHKKALKLQEEREKHQRLVEDLPRLREQHYLEAFYQFRDKAALSPVTGRVLAVGYLRDNGVPTSITNEEGELVEMVFTLLTEAIEGGESVVGHNIFHFDLPFLIRCAWVLGIDVPINWRMGRYWHPQFIDLMDVWQLGQRGEYVSLDTLCRITGGPTKPEGMDGSMFAELFLSGDRVKENLALQYLENDIRMTRHVAEALGVL